MNTCFESEPQIPVSLGSQMTQSGSRNFGSSTSINRMGVWASMRTSGLSDAAASTGSGSTPNTRAFIRTSVGRAEKRASCTDLANVSVTRAVIVWLPASIGIAGDREREQLTERTRIARSRYGTVGDLQDVAEGDAGCVGQDRGTIAASSATARRRAASRYGAGSPTVSEICWIRNASPATPVSPSTSGPAASSGCVVHRENVRSRCGR